MALIASNRLLSGVSVRDYLWGDRTFLRRYQDRFLETYGREITGDVVELGGTRSFNHRRFFPQSRSFRCTNIEGDYDDYLDITQMPFPDDSQDAYVCVSVLEHVFQVQRAVSEIERTLKPGGSLLIASPFSFPVHGDCDYWRFSESFYKDAFQGYDVHAFVHLGTRVSTVADALQRSRKNYRPRYLAYKAVGLLAVLALKYLETMDAFPGGYGIYATKRSN